MSKTIRELRQELGIPVKDIVEVIKPMYPKFDKVMQSKAENPEYGVELRKDAVEAVYRKFAPEKLEKRDTHRLTCRISCRLENEDCEKLKLISSSEGYETMQEFLSDIVLEIIKNHYETERSQNGKNT